MICRLSNSCNNRHLCCHHCKEKKCADRCKDRLNGCPWHDDKPMFFVYVQGNDGKLHPKFFTLGEVLQRVKKRSLQDLRMKAKITDVSEKQRNVVSMQ